MTRRAKVLPAPILPSPPSQGRSASAETISWPSGVAPEPGTSVEEEGAHGERRKSGPSPEQDTTDMAPCTPPVSNFPRSLSQTSPLSAAHPSSPFQLRSTKPANLLSEVDRPDARMTASLPSSSPTSFLRSDPLVTPADARAAMMCATPRLAVSDIGYDFFEPIFPSPEHEPALDLSTLLDQMVRQQDEITRGYNEALQICSPTGADHNENGEDQNGGRPFEATLFERESRVTRRIAPGDRIMMRLMRHYVEVVGPWVSRSIEHQHS